jgi:hypothetical protein
MMAAAASDPLDPPAGVSGAEIDHLFSLPLDEFIASREELARKLRKEDPEAGAWVKGLRKPSRAAWLVNQLVRSEAKGIERLLTAADDLASGQQALAQGSGDAAGLRHRAHQERDAVTALVEAAGNLDAEVSEATLDRVRDTLNAVALDEEARRRVEAGRLTRELQATGFGPLLVPTELGGEKTGARAEGRPTKAEGRKREKVQRQRTAARQGLEERQRLLAEARRVLREATSDRDRAQERLDEATTNERRAGQALSKAEARVQEAEKRLKAVDGG